MHLHFFVKKKTSNLDSQFTHFLLDCLIQSMPFSLSLVSSFGNISFVCLGESDYLLESDASHTCYEVVTNFFSKNFNRKRKNVILLFLNIKSKYLREDI